MTIFTSTVKLTKIKYAILGKNNIKFGLDNLQIVFTLKFETAFGA